MPRIARFHRHYRSTKAVEVDLSAQGNGGVLEDTRLAQIFDDLRKTNVTICETSCPMYIKGRCFSTGNTAPVGEECELQRISRERNH
jgi:hypothetical protein